MWIPTMLATSIGSWKGQGILEFVFPRLVLGENYALDVDFDDDFSIRADISRSWLVAPCKE